jgi:hypothetical protein
MKSYDYWWDDFLAVWAVVAAGSALKFSLIELATNANGEREEAADVIARSMLLTAQAVRS